MRTMLKGGLLFVVVLLGILLVSNLDKGVTTESPNELRLILEPPQTMQQVAEKYPELQVDEETNTITVPESKTEAYTKKLVDNHDAKQVMRVESTPAFHFDRYWKAVSDKVTGYFEGDLGRITYQSSNAQSYSLNAMLVQMVIRSLTYLLPGLLV
ncbi:MAG TPA: hypothetical protein VFV52_06615, partial [Bacilli bacterium]|nr:hypothetical protein [Bacilli bacterium]